MTSPSSPPGWYHDAGSQQWWWWDGYRWLAPPTPAPSEESDRTWFPSTPPLGFGAAVAAIAFIVGLTVVSRLVAAADGTAAAVLGLVVLAVSTIGMPLLAWFASRRWGTGRPIADLGLRFRWIDAPLGFAGAIVLMITVMVVNMVSFAIGVPRGSNLTEVAEGGRDVITFAILFVMAGLLAPVTEELLFRATMQRGLESRFGVWIAVTIQAAVFGAAHITPSEGWGNANLILSLAITGLGLGALVRLTGRVGTAIVAHAIFNCLQLGLLWLTLGVTSS